MPRGHRARSSLAQNIKEVYGADGCVYTHPANGLPAVLINPGNGRVSNLRKVMERNMG